MKNCFKSYMFFILLIACLVAAVTGVSYYRYVVERNFVIQVNTACNPSAEQCFISDCSPADDLSCPVGPYKKIDILDAGAPPCLEEHSCSDFTCGGIASCNETYCSSENLGDGESCASTTGETSS